MQVFTADDRHLNSAYGFSYLYADALTPELVRRATAAWDGRPGQGWPSWAFSNHDAPRAVSRWAEGRDPDRLARMAMLLLLSLRGNAFIYQGEELGLPQGQVPFDRLVDPEAIANWPRTLGRDGARTPMPWRGAEPHAGFSAIEPWLPVDPRHPALAVDRQEDDPASVLHLTRRLIALRRREPALRLGSLRFLNAPDPILAFERIHDGEVLTCVFNLGHEATRWASGPDHSLIESVNLSDPASSELGPLAGLIARRASI
jgi:alpha-glucosidase